MSKLSTHRRDRLVRLAILAGIAVAALSALESVLPWVAAFCGFLGDGCRDTERYHLLGFPIAPWGIGFYLALGLLQRYRPAWLFPAVMAGVGFEAALVKIMLADGFLCVFCAANCLLVLLLGVALFDRKRLWETAATVLLFFLLGSSLVSDGRTRSGTDFSSATVAARVGGHAITEAELERPLTTEIHKLRQSIYQLKNLVLQNRIDDLLLETEARAQGISSAALVEKIRAQLPPPAPRVVDHYYDSGLYRSWGEWLGSAEEIKAKIKTHLHHRDSDPLVQEYCRRLREKYPVEIFLKSPPLPLTQVSIEGAPSLGPENALVTVVEFSDYLCPSCRKAHETVRRVREKYRGKIRWVFKDYPLDRHPGAKQLALAAQCAHAQGKFWEYQERLFSSGTKPVPAEVVTYAKELGLDPARFEECLAAPALVAAVEQSIADATAAGIGSTPTFLINGRTLTGSHTFEEFSEVIDQALAEAESAKH